MFGVGAGPATAGSLSGRPSIDGTWVESHKSVDTTVRAANGEVVQMHTAQGGYGSTLLLHTKGNTVFGTGNYRMEAGRSGTVTVSGHYKAPTLTLKITRDYGQIATYKATVARATQMDGVMSYEGYGSSKASFVRP
jgi:hypothetical protein